MVRDFALATALVAAAASPAAFAAPDPVAHAGVPRVQIQQQRAAVVSSVDFDAVRGDYELVDGAAFRLSGARHRPVAALRDGAPTPMVALSATRFAAVDGSLQIEFLAAPNGNVYGVSVAERQPRP